jgi:hypothetical protein
VLAAVADLEEEEWSFVMERLRPQEPRRWELAVAGGADDDMIMIMIMMMMMMVVVVVVGLRRMNMVMTRRVMTRTGRVVKVVVEWPELIRGSPGPSSRVRAIGAGKRRRSFYLYSID